MGRQHFGLSGLLPVNPPFLVQTSARTGTVALMPEPRPSIAWVVLDIGPPACSYQRGAGSG